MEDQNMNQDPSRFEETPQKESGFKNAMKTLGAYFKSVFLDFISSFKYNNMKLAAILVAVPGVFLGFFLRFHATVVNQISFDTGKKVIEIVNGVEVEKAVLHVVPFDFTGIVLFMLMLFGILNIFSAVTMSGKKNLGSVVICTISTAVIVIAGALYMFALFTFLGGVDSGAIRMNKAVNVDSNWIISIASVIVSMVTSIIGCVLGFINYDRTYEKVDR